MENNTIPAEVRDAIEAFADECTKNLKMDTEYHVGYNNGMEAGVIAGATEYALKLEQAKELLAMVVKRHEAGLLPDRFIYNTIKDFLDGSK